MTEQEKYGFTNDWTISEKYPGYVYKTLVFEEGTSRIYRPMLEPEERAKREKLIMGNIARIVAPYLKQEARADAG